MICQHCETWNVDDDHRCQRCGRRIRSTPRRPSPDTYPIAATATAHAYDFAQVADEEASQSPAAQVEQVPESAQRPLFSLKPQNRVIPFDSLTSAAVRDSIRARQAEVSRPEPLQTAKVEVSPRKHRKSERERNTQPRGDQQRLDFFGQPEVLTQPQSDIICDAPVAPAALRFEAAAIDSALIGTGCAAAALTFHVGGGTFDFDKHALPFVVIVLAAIVFVYKLIWVHAGLDTIGMSAAGLRLVDFDGNRPSRDRRYQRLFGSVISLLAAGMGLVWSFVDQDRLTWHDHMSTTFPTVKPSK